MRHSALFAVLILGCGSPAVPPNILLISIDTLRADHLGLYGYDRPTTPELERWFGPARIFERAYATEASTSPSVVSMLTGLSPQQHGVRLLYRPLDAEISTLPELLAPAGYRSAAVVSNQVLTDEALGIASRFGHYDDTLDELEPGWSVYQRRAAGTTDAALAWLDGPGDGPEPHLLWVHYIDPHGPYAAPADAPRDFSHPEPHPIDLRRVQKAHQVAGAGNDGLEYLDRYDEEIAYVDREIGRLLDGYAERGRAERAVLVLTADHGETMMEFELWFRHGYQVYEPIIRVPLAIRAPGIAPGREPLPVSLVDLTPTLLALAGVEAPPELRGRNLLEPSGEPVFAEARWGPVLWRAVIDAERKWVVGLDVDGSELERSHYHIDEEGSATPTPWEDAPATRALAERIQRDPHPGGLPRDQLPMPNAPNVAPGLGAEALEWLRALGYVDDGH